MIISSVAIHHLRNITQTSLSPTSGVTVLCGDNAQGKTSALEAIYLVTNQKNLRSSSYDDVVQESAPFSKVTLTCEQNGRRFDHELRLVREGNRFKKSFTENGISRSRAKRELQTAAVFFGPAEMRLLSGPPSRRRAFLDTILTPTDSNSAPALDASYDYVDGQYQWADITSYSVSASLVDFIVYWLDLSRQIKKALGMAEFREYFDAEQQAEIASLMGSIDTAYAAPDWGAIIQSVKALDPVNRKPEQDATKNCDWQVADGSVTISARQPVIDELKSLTDLLGDVELLGIGPAITNAYQLSVGVEVFHALSNSKGGCAPVDTQKHMCDAIGCESYGNVAGQPWLSTIASDLGFQKAQAATAKYDFTLGATLAGEEMQKQFLKNDDTKRYQTDMVVDNRDEACAEIQDKGMMDLYWATNCNLLNYEDMFARYGQNSWCVNTGSGAGGEPGEVNCDASIPDQEGTTVDKSRFVRVAEAWRAGGGENAEQCFNDVVYRANQAGINADYALWAWLHESGASNYAGFPYEIEDFGVHGFVDVPAKDFNQQITKFLTLDPAGECLNEPGIGTDYWLGFSTNYLNGNCDPDFPHPVSGQTGREYLAEMEKTWNWIVPGYMPPDIHTPSGDGGGVGVDFETSVDENGNILVCGTTQSGEEEEEEGGGGGGSSELCGPYPQGQCWSVLENPAVGETVTEWSSWYPNGGDFTVCFPYSSGDWVHECTDGEWENGTCDHEHSHAHVEGDVPGKGDSGACYTDRKGTLDPSDDVVDYTKCSCLPEDGADCVPGNSCAQCTDYVMAVYQNTDDRFKYPTATWAMRPAGGNAESPNGMWWQLNELGVFYENDGNVPPQPGDIAAMGYGGRVTHAAIICEVGENTVSICQYNSRESYPMTYDPSSNHVSPGTIELMGWSRP